MAELIVARTLHIGNGVKLPKRNALDVMDRFGQDTLVPGSTFDGAKYKIDQKEIDAMVARGDLMTAERWRYLQDAMRAPARPEEVEASAVTSMGAPTVPPTPAPVSAAPGTPVPRR